MRVSLSTRPRPSHDPRQERTIYEDSLRKLKLVVHSRTRGHQRRCNLLGQVSNGRIIYRARVDPSQIDIYFPRQAQQNFQPAHTIYIFKTRRIHDYRRMHIRSPILLLNRPTTAPPTLSLPTDAQNSTVKHLTSPHPPSGPHLTETPQQRRCRRRSRQRRCA